MYMSNRGNNPTKLPTAASSVAGLLLTLLLLGANTSHHLKQRQLLPLNPLKRSLQEHNIMGLINPNEH